MDKRAKAIKAVLNTAAVMIGTKEIGNNDGPQVRKFLAAAGVTVPAPWCAAFVEWCFENAGPEGKPLADVWKPQNLAYCPSIYAWARATGILHSKPREGDVFLYVENGVALHTGFVRGVSADGTKFTTVEGNTNGAGSFDGDVVASKERTVSYVYVFARPSDLIRESAPSDTTWVLKDKSGKKVAEMSERGGRSWIKLRDWQSATGQSIEWDQNAQAPRVGGRLWTKPFEIREGNLAWAMVSDLLGAASLPYRVDLSAHSVVLL